MGCEEFHCLVLMVTDFYAVVIGRCAMDQRQVFSLKVGCALDTIISSGDSQ